MNTIEHALATLAACRKTLTDLLSRFPADKATFQPAAVVNHALWQVGHLAHTEDWYVGLLDGKSGTLPQTYAALFGYGSTIETPEAYPSFGEVKKHLHTVRERLVAAVLAGTDDKLAGRCAELGTDLLGGLFSVAWHEGWHSGQLSIIRRALDLPSIYG